jgi:Ca2+-binding RTX toxin-like protein
MSRKISLEKLESRNLLAQVSLISGTLSVVGTTIQVAQLDSDTITLTADGKVTNFDNVSRLALFGNSHTFNDITNSTSLPSTIVGGPKGNMLQAFGGNDTIFCGAGADTVYDILGTNQVISLDGSKAKDTLFVNAASSTIAKNFDQVVKFFDVGRTPGSGSVQLVNQVLYLTPSDEGTNTLVSQTPTRVNVTVNYGNVIKSFAFPRSQVKYIGYFGGAGNDRFINNTSISEVAYGGLGGADTMFGNVGTFSFMKGGGDNDTLVGRSQRNDLSGNGGNDVLISTNGVTVFRTDFVDFIIGRKKNDRVLVG